jgi:hypothetical protein
MGHPLQAHFDRVSTLLRELGTKLQDDPSFQRHRARFDEYLDQNELELALHAACDGIMERSTRCSDEVVRMIDDAHCVMGLHDGCVEALRKLSGVY